MNEKADRRLTALAEAIAVYEKKHGVISGKELAKQARTDRKSTTTVHGGRRPLSKPRRRKTA